MTNGSEISKETLEMISSLSKDNDIIVLQILIIRVKELELEFMRLSQKRLIVLSKKVIAFQKQKEGWR